MFIKALFTIARIWKQPTNKRPSTQEWIKNIWYTYTMEYYSAKRKNEIMPFAVTWMDLEIVTLSELSQTKANIAYMWNLKKKKKRIQMNLFTEQKQSYRCGKYTYGYQGEKRRKDKQEDWD